MVESNSQWDCSGIRLLLSRCKAGFCDRITAQTKGSMLWKGNTLDLLFLLQCRNCCGVTYFSIMGQFWKTAKIGYLFWNYWRIMPECYFLLAPLLGHANSCIYCVTKTRCPCSYYSALVIWWEYVCATCHMCVVLWLGLPRHHVPHDVTWKQIPFSDVYWAMLIILWMHVCHR